METPSNDIPTFSFSALVMRELTRGVLEEERPIRFSARGQSMSPFVRDRDVITVTPLGDAPLDRGDIALYLHPINERIVVHRVIGFEKGAFVIRGDNAHGVDGVIPPARILGRVTSVERNGRRLRFGHGLERRFIALLSLSGTLVPLVRTLARIKRLIPFRRVAA